MRQRFQQSDTNEFKRRQFWLVADVYSTYMTTAPKQPNILLFESDQQRTDTMACYGNDWIKSPNLNRLADESYVFENAYVTQAVCTPSRGSLMTGLYPHSHGCMINKTQLHKDIKYNG